MKQTDHEAICCLTGRVKELEGALRDVIKGFIDAGYEKQFARTINEINDLLGEQSTRIITK